MPIGNLTSQLFANIYMNELDQFVKHKLKVRYYVRYTDDFVIVSTQRKYLENFLGPIGKFLKEGLALTLHPQKIILRKYRQGIDFLGYVILPNHTIIRTKTRKRMFRKLERRIERQEKREITKESLRQTIASYEGVLMHANAHKLIQNLKNRI